MKKFMKYISYNFPSSDLLIKSNKSREIDFYNEKRKIEEFFRKL